MDRSAALKQDPLARIFLGDYLPRLKECFSPDQVWLFGSRARGDALEESDLDVLVVSERFATIPWPERAAQVLIEAGIGHNIELLCYTRAEFDVKRSELGTVSAALEEGERVV